VSTTYTGPETAAVPQPPPTPPGESAGVLAAPAGIDESERIDRLDAFLAREAEQGMEMLQRAWSTKISPADQKILRAALDRRHKPAAAAADAARELPL
jgi:hypothetical protein